jgi:tetratricopeptide (TPR) repeat protein
LQAVVAIVLLLVLTAAAYHDALSNEFSLDDTGIVMENRFVVEAAWGKLWTTSYWQGVTGNRGGLYRPLTLTIVTLERELFGEGAAPYHVVSILLHMLAAGSLVSAARRTGLSAGSAWLAGAMLCVHPAASEVVNTVVGMADVLVFVLGISGASLLLTARSTWTTLLAAAMITLAALCKESAAIFAAAAIIALLFHERRPLPLIAAVTALVLPVCLRVALTSHLDPGGIGFLDNPLAFADTMTRWLNAPALAVRYLLLVVFPWPLSADYSYDAIPVIAAADVSAWLPPALACASLLAMLRPVLRKDRNTTLWIGVSLAMLALATHLVVPLGTIYAERLAYPIVAGGCVLGAALADRLRRKSGRIGWFVVPVWLLLFLLLTQHRTRQWQNDGTLFDSAIQIRGNSARVHYGLGHWQQQQGQHLQALASYQQALQIHPRYPDALYNQGAALLRLDRLPEALASYEAATRARPGHVQSLFAAAVVKEALGLVGATDAYLAVLQLRPQHAEAARGAARCLVVAGDTTAALMIVQRVFATAAESE